jgi:hypothetical protein
VLRHWNRIGLGGLLEAHRLTGTPEEPFPNDGWSGAQLTLLRRGGEGFVLKRTSWAADWIARATRDHAIREAFVATGQLRLPEPLEDVYLGVAADGSAAAILMPDLSAELLAWERPGGRDTLSLDALDRVLDAIARLHRQPWGDAVPAGGGLDWPWCPLPERLALLTRSAAERYRAGGLAVGERFLAGWDAFDRSAPAAARSLVDTLSSDASPLVAALGRLPSTGLHGDLKLANVALLGGNRVGLIDWQMTAFAPVAVELGWLLVSNVAILPESPDAVLARYLGHLGAAARHELAVAPPRGAAEGWEGAIRYPPLDVDEVVGDWDAQVDLAWIVGLLLRGWRKGLDASSGTPTGWGAGGSEDLASWCERAVTAADRRL